jgi:hypothetical protein
VRVGLCGGQGARRKVLRAFFLFYGLNPASSGTWNFTTWAWELGLAAFGCYRLTRIDLPQCLWFLLFPLCRFGLGEILHILFHIGGGCCAAEYLEHFLLCWGIEDIAGGELFGLGIIGAAYDIGGLGEIVGGVAELNVGA